MQIDGYCLRERYSISCTRWAGLATLITMRVLGWHGQITVEGCPVPRQIGGLECR